MATFVRSQLLLLLSFFFCVAHAFLTNVARLCRLDQAYFACLQLYSKEVAHGIFFTTVSWTSFFVVFLPLPCLLLIVSPVRRQRKVFALSLSLPLLSFPLGLLISGRVLKEDEKKYPPRAPCPLLFFYPRQRSTWKHWKCWASKPREL